jgi:hypothetical protein
MFKKGDKVTWLSQSGGCTREKNGEVVAVVPDGQSVSCRFLSSQGLDSHSRRFDGVSPRDHTSYLIAVRSGKTDKSALVLYWPLFKNLRAA